MAPLAHKYRPHKEYILHQAPWACYGSRGHLQNGRVEGLTEWRGGPGFDRMKDEHVGEGAKQQLLVSCEQRALRREVSLRVDLGMGAEE